ncbi:hypothetical protein C5B41_17035 [Acinetobacter ursingii]|nr:hypothetical protein C5B41_17035 [Acinetobacter ursingii]
MVQQRDRMSKDRKWEITSKFINICIALTQSTKRNSGCINKREGEKLPLQDAANQRGPFPKFADLMGKTNFAKI